MSSSAVVTLGTTVRHLIPGSQLPFIITAATSDSYIYAINRDTMQQVCKLQSELGLYNSNSVICVVLVLFMLQEWIL